MAHTKHDTERSRRATDETEAVDKPKQGETYRCESCGMEVQVTTGCACNGSEAPHFQCCGQELARV